ncbi:MAG: response regulator, partial [Gammaproteobacteria bacterium]|nr:response regulator [Gammaproteobacteria bacterium]
LLKTPLVHEQREHAATISNSAKSLLNIVNDILDFSQIEAGKLKLENTDFELRECVEDVLDLMAPIAQEKGLELIYHLFSDVPTTVRTDPTRLRQVLLNLVTNAVKFTPAGSVVVRIMQDNVDENDVDLQFTVTDTGIGLSSHNQRRLFRAFSRGNTPTVNKPEGSGLGLMISKRLVEQMQGQIFLESEPNQGTTVTFTIRCERVEHQPVVETTTRLRGSTALLYDPHPAVRLALHEAMSHWGMKVNEVVELDKLEHLQEKDTTFDIAVLGLAPMSPDLTKADSLVTSIQPHITCPILMLVPGMCQESAHHLASIGVSSCLTKPVRYKRLHRELGMLVRKVTDPVLPTGSDLQTTPKDTISFHGINILVAEDNEISARLLTTLLTAKGAKVTVANDGKQTLENANSGYFDLILMDIHMPEMNGDEVTAMIRVIERGVRHTPIIALTADALSGSREKCLSNGMDDYLAKPIDEDHLFALVNSWTERRAESIADSTDDAPANGKIAKTDSGKIIDQNKALKITGGREGLADELLGMLINDLPKYRTRFDKASAQRDMPTIGKIAHTLAGGASYCGATTLSNAAKDVEKQSLSGNSWESITDLMNKLYTAMDSVVAEVKKINKPQGDR